MLNVPTVRRNLRERCWQSYCWVEAVLTPPHMFWAPRTCASPLTYSQVHFQSRHRPLSRSYLAREDQESAFGSGGVGRANAGWAVPPQPPRGWIQDREEGEGRQWSQPSFCSLFLGPAMLETGLVGYHYFFKYKVMYMQRRNILFKRI